jgi:hypothetical protein
MTTGDSHSVAIVTAGDDEYFSLLDSFLASIEAAQVSDNFKICVFDLGLTPEQRSNVQSRTQSVLVPEWTLDFPNRQTVPIGLQAMYERPFLTRYFAGFETYLWIDADTWVQDRNCLLDYVNAAQDGRIALTPEQFDSPHGYRAVQGRRTVRQFVIAEKSVRDHIQDCYKNCFGPDKSRYAFGPLANSGIMSLRGDSPIWKTWQQYLATGLSDGHIHRLVEQQAMNLAIQENAVAVKLMPARCNWNLAARHPALDPFLGRLVDPADGAPLGMIHLTDLKIYQSVVLPMVGGGMARVPLRYRQFMETAARGPGAWRAGEFESSSVETIVEV